MRIVVTGGTGFLGSHLVEHLLSRGHEVAILLRPTSDPWRLLDVLDRIHLIYGSLHTLDALHGQLREFRTEAVAHLAWAGVDNNERNSALQARNIVDTVGLASLCAELGVETFVGAGSQAEYGPYPHAIREDDVPRPTTLYGKSKLAAGTMTEQVAAQHGMRFAWLRIFSTYGPRDTGSWLIPTMIKRLHAGERMSLTACEQRWGFLHARDAAAAFRTVLEAPSANGVFNVGITDAAKLRQTVTLLQTIMESSAELGYGDIPYRPDQVMVLSADVARLTTLGWRPEVELEDGLRETVAWYVSKP